MTISDFLPSLGVISASFLLAFGATFWLRHALTQKAILDRPNERSSHTIPIPRGGGWGILLALLPGLSCFLIMHNSLMAYSGLFSGALLLVLVSWLDDKKGLGAGVRLGSHLFAAYLGSLTFPHNLTLFGHLLPFWLDRTLMIIAWAWFMNLYNFMDGIDGLTGVETISLAFGTCLVLSQAQLLSPFLDMLTLLLMGASLGFLAFNWHPAKIFLGDVGSVPLGFLSGFLLISLALHGLFVAALILPLYYLSDSGITLLKRILRGERFWQAHRQHFYQKAAQGLKRHDFVVYAVMLGNLALILAALFAAHSPLAGTGCAIVTVAFLLLWMHIKGQKQG